MPKWVGDMTEEEKLEYEQRLEHKRVLANERMRRYRAKKALMKSQQDPNKVESIPEPMFDQSRRVLSLGVANPKQAEFFESETLYTCYGGARGGGKSWAIRIKAVGGALKWAGIRILIIRRTYPELQQNHIEPIIKLVPSEFGTYNGSLRTMYFKNGSFIKFGHAQSMTAIETEYQGQEYDWIFLDEATQFTEQEFRTLGGCLRGVNEIPKRFYLTCNPGGIGHNWVKRLFITRQFKTDSANPEENENPDDYKFIFASVDDNTALMQSKGGEAYKQMLSALPEKMRRAHRYGDWDAMSGAYFDEFSPSVHVCEPFQIPNDWRRYRSIDYGLDRLACYWVAVSPEGHNYVYREYCESNLVVSRAAEEILMRTLPTEHISITFAPPDVWNRQKDSGKSMAEGFMTAGIGLVKANNNRVQGHMMVKEMLAPMPDGKPSLIIFSTCKELIECLSIIQCDERDPNDCAKQPHEITHAVDAIRYYCISRVLSSDGSPVIQQPDDDIETGAEDYDDVMTGGCVTASYLNY